MEELKKILEEIDQEIEKERTMCEGIEDTPGWRLYEKTMKMAKLIIRKHLSRENDPEIKRLSRDNDGWIPVEEWLPEDEEMVLVTCKTKAGRISVNRAWYGEGFWHGTGSMSGVIAWRPLPEPYRPERRNK